VTASALRKDPDVATVSLASRSAVHRTTGVVGIGGAHGLGAVGGSCLVVTGLA
jgi:hypothetical protein